MLLRLTVALILCSAAMTYSAAAQEPSPGGSMLNVSTTRILPADAARFEGLVERLASAAREINLDPGFGWHFWNNAFDYVLVYPFENMAYWDDPEQWMRQFQGTAVEARVNELYEEFATIEGKDTANEILQTVPNWSYMLEEASSSEQSAFIEVLDIWLKPGKTMEWDALAQDYADFLEEIEYPYPAIGYRVMFGVPRVVYVILFDSMEAFYGANSIERLIEAKGLSETWGSILERFVALAAGEEVRTQMAKPNMGYRVVP